MAHGQANAEVLRDMGPTLTLLHEAPIVAHTLRAEGFDASEDGTGRGVPLVPVCYDTTQITSPGNYSQPKPGDACHPLAASAHVPLIAFPERMSATAHASSENLSPALGAKSPTAVAFDMRGREGGAQFEGPPETANIRAASGGSSRSYVAQNYAVRRLTPTECERLQGFPDGFTQVPYRGKPAADGPRYKALGNSMAVNVMRRIGRRIEYVERLMAEAGK
jgi:DNA (cytosine-5)-methyltransferase 1